MFLREAVCHTAAERDRLLLLGQRTPVTFCLHARHALLALYNNVIKFIILTLLIGGILCLLRRLRCLPYNFDEPLVVSVAVENL